MAPTCCTPTLIRRRTPAGWPSPAVLPGGYFAGSPLAGLRSIFYSSSTSLQLKPWAKAYRDFSDLMGKIVATVVPLARFPPQVLLIDYLRRDDADAFTRAKASELADTLNFNALIVGVIGGVVALIPGFQILALVIGPACALSAAAAACLKDYSAGRPINVDTLARAVVGFVAVIGATDKLPPELRRAAEDARDNPAVRRAAAEFAARNKSPQGTSMINDDVAIVSFARYTLRNATQDPRQAPTPPAGTYSGKYTLRRALFTKAWVRAGQPTTVGARVDVWRSLSFAPVVEGAIVEANRLVPRLPGTGQMPRGPITGVPGVRRGDSTPSTGIPAPVLIGAALLVAKVLL